MSQEKQTNKAAAAAKPPPASAWADQSGNGNDLVKSPSEDAGHDHVALAVPPPRELLTRSLEALAAEPFALGRDAAVLLLGYLRKRPGPDGNPAPIPSDVAGYARWLQRSQPSAWVAVAACDYMRFSRALALSDLAVMTAAELQAACGEVELALRG